MKIYLIYGPQGSGKSTQAKLLAEKLDLILVSAGDISRKIASQDSPEGRRVKDLIDRGEPTPNEIIVPAVDKLLDNAKNTNGFVFDGYPRYTQQIEPLILSLEKHGWQVDKAIFIDLPKNAGIKRILLRAKIEGRIDDTPKTITHRLQLYHEQTEPIINYFRQLGLVVQVDGSGTIEEVHQSIWKSLGR